MKSLTEIYTQQTKDLQDLNQEIRQRLSSMRSCTEQEMQNLEVWHWAAQNLVENLNNDLCLISQHLQILKTALLEKQLVESSKD